MKKATKKTTKKSSVTPEFRPYRVLFLIVVLAVTCIVLFSALGVTSDR